MADHIIALDQGTTSTRAIIFDREGRIVASAQREHRQHFPKPGWVEHDALEIWRNARNCLGLVLADAQLSPADIAAVGITNQRETTILWDRATGRPLHRAIVWQDVRTQDLVDRMAEDGGIDRFRDRTGLPLNTYFSATKIAWLLDHIPDARARAEAGDLCVGTVDSWLTWQLTGGVDGGVHITDVTNASRSSLMRLDTCEWDPEILEAFGIPPACLPEIRSSSEVYGRCTGRSPVPGVPVAGILGDQQAAQFGQTAFERGEAKNTYGTGAFLVYGTGTEPVRSDHGLLTTVAYRLGDGPTHYALEGSIAVTGSLVQWLRDNLGIISTSAEVEQLAATVEDNGGCYIVPAFSGLYAPWWRPDARGVIVGLTGYINRGHIARAALEAAAYQTCDVLDACNANVPEPLEELRVDGGMTVNDALMQLQADLLNVPVVRPEITETTAVGAAYAAGLAVGFWSGLEELREIWREDRRFEPSMDAAERERLLAGWRRAVTRSFDLA
ncbi:glycerol kinase GlpK [Gulosibacter sp. 10]|uniref:glycerol kinase GlpK n=1 Tax=Gulosibacter sp. 10 TaxID=1255570 RepID=UPI00097EF9B4|nr:glycerol kinase GlpK [Gulosibacter sp. 10]SJM71536.1 Glycerol kinase [Gulosibacter sp. 10]